MHAFGGIGHQAQYTTDRTIGLAHSGVGHIEIYRLALPATIDVERAILGRIGLPGLSNTAQQWLQVIPQLTPVLLRRATQGMGVLDADGGCIGFVVQRYISAAPEQHELRLGRQKRGQYRLQVR